jgi:hypothetical protein
MMIRESILQETKCEYKLHVVFLCCNTFGHEVQSVIEEGQTIVTKSDVYGRVTERTEAVDRSGAVQKFVYQTDAWGNVKEERYQLNASEWATTGCLFILMLLMIKM